jgi:arylsulfatase A-like enzyme
MNERPNILYVFTDQQSAQALSCAGNPDLHTPNLDALAGRGVRFANAFCAEPICSPARASMLTGRMPSTAGVPENNLSIDPALRRDELGNLLKRAGYDCGYAGKWHLSPYTIDDPADHGFDWSAPFGDAALTENCLEFLSAKRDKPFFLIASYDNPHNICEWHRDQNLPWGNLPDPDLADCPNLPANYHAAPYEPEVLRLIQQTSPGCYGGGRFTPDRWRKFRWAYNRLVEKVDAQIGALLKGLDQLGLTENTLVVFSSDHGDGEGHHRWNNKQVLFEESIRVPLILALPGRFDQGLVRDELVSNGLDLLPTLCDVAGAEMPDDLPGSSLVTVLEGDGQDPWRDELPIEACVFEGGLSPNRRPLGRCLRGLRYKYVCYSWGAYREQLHDIRADPGEMVNLAVEKRYDPLIRQFRRKLRSWCQSIGDRFAKALPADAD